MIPRKRFRNGFRGDTDKMTDRRSNTGINSLPHKHGRHKEAIITVGLSDKALFK